MIRFTRNKAIGFLITVIGVAGIFAANAMAQSTGSSAATLERLNRNYHIGFDRPESWGLKYFASTSLLSGLQPPEPPEGHRIGSISTGLELGWLPELDEGQRRIGFNVKSLVYLF